MKPRPRVIEWLSQMSLKVFLILCVVTVLAALLIAKLVTSTINDHAGQKALDVPPRTFSAKGTVTMPPNGGRCDENGGQLIIKSYRGQTAGMTNISSPYQRGYRCIYQFSIADVEDIDWLYKVTLDYRPIGEVTKGELRQGVSLNYEH